MLPQLLVVATKPTFLGWSVPGAPEGLTDVVVHVYDSEEAEIPASPFSCVEHPTLTGVYQASVVIPTVGTYRLAWDCPSLGLTDDQPVLCVASYSNTALVVVLVQDSISLLPQAGVEVMAIQDDGNGWVLKAYGATDSMGYTSFQLVPGTYRLMVRHDNEVFEENVWEFLVENDDLRIPHRVRVHGIVPPNVEYVPPTTFVTMALKLVSPMGEPLRFRDVTITCLRPSQYAHGQNFIIAGNQKAVKTDSQGVGSVQLLPGAVVEVHVEGTDIRRRFTVPVADFNLFDYIVTAGNDYFNVVQNPYPEV